MTILLMLICAYNVYSQGTIRGVVTDSLTGDRLVGANVFLEGTSHGAAANVEGIYIIKGVPA
jgi:hypothetical protein